MKDKLTTASLIATVLVLMLVLCLGSFVAGAQQSTVPRVGFLAGGSPPAFQHLIEAFRQGMRERGYIDGQNFVIEIRAAEGRRSEEHTSELQSLAYLVCRLLLEKKKKIMTTAD